MNVLKWLLVGLLALPALELLGFLLIATFIGWLWAGLLLIAGSLVGVRLLRKFSGQDLARMRAGLADEGLRAIRLHDPAVARIAGALLLAVPGFITDAIGAALFVPALRKRMAAALLAGVRKRSVRTQEKTLDLAPSEWREEKSERE